MSGNGIETKYAIHEAICKACLYKDDMEWQKWLDLCDDDFEYAITAYSPEISSDMTYLSGNRAEMLTMMEMLPKHNTDHSPLRRHCTVYSVDIDESANTATAISSFVVYQTLLDGMNSHVDAGESKVFVVGRYVDSFRISGDQIKFTARQARLDTRRLDKGSHYPI